MYIERKEVDSIKKTRGGKPKGKVREGEILIEWIMRILVGVWKSEEFLKTERSHVFWYRVRRVREVRMTVQFI